MDSKAEPLSEPAIDEKYLEGMVQVHHEVLCKVVDLCLPTMNPSCFEVNCWRRNTVGVLSDLLRVVLSRTSKHWTAASLCRKPPANSKSLLDMELVGFLSVTNSSMISVGHCPRQTIGDCGGLHRELTAVEGNQTPPTPEPEAS